MFGQSPAGLNSTGESDIRNYYDNIKQAQEKRLRFGVGKIYNALFRSVTGTPPPENFDFSFRPLWQLTDVEKSTICASISNSIKGLNDSGIIDRATALKELRTSAQITGVFQSIDNEQIKEAAEEPPPNPNEMQGVELPPEEKEDPTEKTKDSAYKLTDEYRELLSQLSKYDQDEVLAGLKVEREHFDTTEGNELVMMGIVRDHLMEDPQYYTKLQSAGI